MSLLNHAQIENLLRNGVVQHGLFSNVNATSLDITLGNKVLVELEYDPFEPPPSVSLGDRTPLGMKEVDITGGFLLRPGQFILAHSYEIFHLPTNISAEYKLKSSMARIGLEHLNAGWCDAGWHGSSLTLELKNMTQSHCILIKSGDKIGQMVFFEHQPVSETHSYATKGRYNGDTTVQGVKK